MTTEGAQFREMMYAVVHTRMEFRRMLQRLLKSNNTGITFEMLQILSSLWQQQGISQQILAERTAKDKACMTNLMTNLEKKGYIYRIEDPQDRRNKLVYLTEEGKKFSDRLKPLLTDAYARAEKEIGMDNIRTILSGLERIKAEIEKM